MLRQTNKSRGQVGIQTLLIFIAMIAVAAITAGVLLQTADSLQEDADRTGTQSQEQVSDRLDIVETYGEVGEDELRIQVSLPAGAESVDLTQTQVNILGEEGDELFVEGDASTEGEFETEDVAGGGDFDGEVLTDQSQIAELTMNLNGGLEILSEDEYTAGEELDVTLRTGAGAETEEGLLVPDPLTGESGDTFQFE